MAKRGFGPGRAARAPDGAGAVAAFFAARGWTPWVFQRQAWEAYRAGRSGLIQVPTGAGKTYAAFMGPLSELIDACAAAGGGGSLGLRVVYVTPLKAVTRDIEAALRSAAEAAGWGIRVESRTGDTPAAVRARQRERLPHVLVTTPESLSLLLTREDAAGVMQGLRCVIVDEWHELMASKRGTQLELGLARVRAFAPGVRTWALSATLPNAEEAARCAVGAGCEPLVVRAEMERRVEVKSILPRDIGRFPWAGHLGLAMLEEVLEALDPARPTLVFTNTRSQAERWYHAVRYSRPEWGPVLALHHGSIDRVERERVEAGLKSGRVRIVVATSSLDLGVDFAPVERVFQIGSPKGIARLVQRAGRGAHRPLAACEVVCVPTHAMELVEIAAARRAVESGELEARTGLTGPLDVLSQHMVTCAMGGGFEAWALYDEVRRAWSYRGLTREDFDWTLAMAREGGALHAYPEFRRIEERAGRHVISTARHGQVHRMNVGTITADTTLEIRYLSGRSLGRIEEYFIAHLREGERFVFAGKVLSFVMLKDLVAYVRPARGRTSHTPIWGGTKLPISESLSHAIRRELDLARTCEPGSPEGRCVAPVLAVQARESRLPRADATLAEVTRTREGYHLFLFPFEGRLVHAGLAALLALRLARIEPATFVTAVNDYGLELLCDREFPYEEHLGPGLLTREGLAGDAMESANTSELARLAFREIARVSGLVIQNRPGQSKTGRQLQASASLIYDVLSEFDPGNLLLEQARREVMERHYEQTRLGRTLDRIGSSRVEVVRTARLTPMSLPLVIERQSARVTSETLLARVERMKAEWSEAGSKRTSRASALS